MHQPQIELKSFVVERHLCLNTICFWMLGSLPRFFVWCPIPVPKIKRASRMLRFSSECETCRSWCFVELLKLLRRMAWWFGWMPMPWWSIRRSPWTFFSHRNLQLRDLFDCVFCLEGRWNTWNTWNSSKKGLTKWCCFDVDYKTALSSVWNGVIEKQLILDLKT